MVPCQARCVWSAAAEPDLADAAVSEPQVGGKLGQAQSCICICQQPLPCNVMHSLLG
jgi:hypothetical protein